MTGSLDVAVTYLPAETGIHQWLEPRPARAAHDLLLIRSQGFDTVRLHLAWDAFMPSHRLVDRRRIADLEAVLDAARAAGLRCQLVLFAQSHGDTVLLPAYAIDRRRPRRGVRVVSGAVEQPGGPRDLYADPLMLEAGELWLRTLLDAFANHPAVALWDLGHDPATTIRPRHIADLAAWCELMGGLVRRRADAVRLTLGAGDVLGARGVRLAAVTPHVDSLGLALDPRRLPIVGDGIADASLPVFAVQLALRLAAAEGADPPALHVVTGLAVDDDPEAPPPVRSLPASPGGVEVPPRWDTLPLIPPAGARATATLLGHLAETGAAGLVATSWSIAGPRPLDAPPYDRLPSLARHGLVDGHGVLRAHGEVWSDLARRETAAQAARPWPSSLDAEQYHAELPSSARDLLEMWRQEGQDRDA